ncbi:MAG: primosomal protein N' [Clostridia bacterium]|nr:primosomal protein N' [Clostridia bacterium]
MQQSTIVSVAVEGTVFHFDKAYSYVFPKELGESIPGTRVMVPFGGGNRRRQAVILEVSQQEDVSQMKCVAEVLDTKPLFSEEMLKLASWMKERTFCTLFDALKTMIPPGLMMRIKPVFRLLKHPEMELTEDEKQIVELLEAVPEGMDRKTLLQSLGFSDECTLPEKLMKQGVLEMSAEASRVAGDSTTKVVRIVEEEEGKLPTLTEKQEKVYELIREVGQASEKEICYFASVTSSVIKTLEKKGLVEILDQEVLRSPLPKQVDTPPIRSTKLNDEQQTAFDGIAKLLQADKASAALLYGVTGSGKTQVYMNLIDQVLLQEKQALVLVPEISLTPQLLDLFVNRYGKRIAVIHSGLSIGERMDEWKRIRRGEASVVIGTRSAVFAPLQNIGLIVFDEEQEHTYKSENSPRYHARDVAKFRCQYHKATLLLASATPSVESYYYAQNGRYSFFELSSRYGNATLPEVQIADMREDTSEYSIGEVLQQEMQECLENGKQVILLLNRRGYNTFVSCRDCGEVITCPSCSISMTYHSANDQLVCHYCGKMMPAVSKCPTCGSAKMRYSGLGTQKVERELEYLFPDAKILRMDADTTMSRYSYEEKFKAFAEGNYQIMIGTQMVAKGLDFPNIGLVGILSADQSLYADDFRCYETSFDLFTQVIGRAGRRDEKSVAIIQTYTPENAIIQYAGEQDYNSFYKQEIEARKLLKYPPYSDICQFGFVSREKQAVQNGCYAFLEMLKKANETQYTDVPIIALKPTAAVVSKVAGKYRFKFLAKMHNDGKTRKMIADVLTEFGRRNDMKQVSVFADINPASMM